MKFDEFKIGMLVKIRDEDTNKIIKGEAYEQYIADKEAAEKKRFDKIRKSIKKKNKRS